MQLIAKLHYSGLNVNETFMCWMRKQEVLIELSFNTAICTRGVARHNFCKGCGASQGLKIKQSLELPCFHPLIFSSRFSWSTLNLLYSCLVHVVSDIHIIGTIAVCNWSGILSSKKIILDKVLHVPFHFVNCFVCHQQVWGFFEPGSCQQVVTYHQSIEK